MTLAELMAADPPQAFQPSQEVADYPAHDHGSRRSAADGFQLSDVRSEQSRTERQSQFSPSRDLTLGELEAADPDHAFHPRLRWMPNDAPDFTAAPRQY